MVVWVADHYADELLGGAEMTSACLMAASPEPVVRLRSAELSDADVDRHRGATWVVENMLGALSSPAACAALLRVFGAERVVRLEYDYNWCRARSPVCHRVLLGGDCDCQADPAQPLARLYALIHGRAHHVFYMSFEQMAVHRRHLGASVTGRASILGSCFPPETIDFILGLGREDHGPHWLVVSRWGDRHDFFKGAPNALALAREMGLPFRTAGGVSHEAFLREMASCAGLIYLPNDLDPSPRTVIEARLMGRRLILNHNVLHKDEEWFREGPPDAVADHLRALPARFWRTALA
jgi:hypothetical protein